MSFKLIIKEVRHETERAICVSVPVAGASGIAEDVWIPISQVDSIHRASNPPYLMITDWIAKQKGYK